MPIVPLTPLATPPDPNDRSTFDARAYPFTVSQQTMVGEFNANVPALNEAATAASGALAASHYKGPWSALTGPLAIPATVTHGAGPALYMLLESVADVTAEVPGVSAKWKDMTVVIPPPKTWTFTTATGTYTVPAGVTSVRAYAVGKGGDGFKGAATNGRGGGGGSGMAYGDIAVTPGQVLQISIVAGVAKLIVGGVDYLVGNPGVSSAGGPGGAGGTATKHANVTNGGAYTGGVGGNALANGAHAGGGSSASPLGNGRQGGVAGVASVSAGGGGIGGEGGNAMSSGHVGGGGGAGGTGSAADPAAAPGGGGGAGGSASTATPGVGRQIEARFTDPLLAPMVSPGGGYQYSFPGPGGGGAYQQKGGSGGGGGASGAGGTFGGGGADADGGIGGGGGGNANGGAAAVFIYA